MSNALQILNNYDEKKYNVLVPVQTMQDFPDIYKMAINTVKIDIAEDTFPMDNEKDSSGQWVPKNYALNKVGLEKLMAAANIQVIESRPIIPTSVSYAAEMAKQLGQPVNFDKRDIAYQVTITVPDLTGTIRTIVATKEMIADEIYQECLDQVATKKKWVNKKQVDCSQEEKEAAAKKSFNQIMKFRNALCESKALNRAIRKALQIKSKYTAEELSKPFAVPIVVPNTEDPDMKRAMIDRYRVGTNALFGIDWGSGPDQTARISAPQQYNALDAPEIEPDTDLEDIDYDEAPEEDEGTEDEDTDNEEDGPVYCEDCGCEIKDFTNAQKQTMIVEQIIEYSNTQFGTDLCAKCIAKREKDRSK